MLEDTGENRTFLLDWLKILVSSNGEEITAENITALTQAIEGNYKLDTYKQCCVSGFCDGYYSYKYGEWKYYHENGKLKAKGTYRIGKKHKKTSCEGGDEINFGYVTNNWKFYDVDGNEIKPSEKDILEIENSSYLDEFEMSKYLNN